MRGMLQLVRDVDDNQHTMSKRYGQGRPELERAVLAVQGRDSARRAAAG